jgi:hypothetical protein
MDKKKDGPKYQYTGKTFVKKAGMWSVFGKNNNAEQDFQDWYMTEEEADGALQKLRAENYLPK